MKQRNRQRQPAGVPTLSARLSDIYLHLLEKEPENTTAADMAHMEQLCKQICELEEASRAGPDKR